MDSNGDGVANNSDPTPFLVSEQLKFTETITNVPPLSVRLQWVSVANGTNSVYYTTNLVAPNWQLLTNFVSPLVWPSPPTNVWIFDPLTDVSRYYQVVVQPNLTFGQPQ